MSLEGTVRNGVVVLDNGAQIPDGTRVRVVLEEPTLLSLMKLAGTAQDLPADFAAQHDHYIHGTTKR